MTPIFKGSGYHCDKSNYRPISIVCHIAKAMEKQIQKQLLTYLVRHNFISTDQSAFIRNHSTQTSLHKVIDDWLHNVNDGLITGVCSLDLHKCFDSINHNTLIKKLQKYGIKGAECSWFKSYLKGRT
mgnify:CR=1 FL=1